VSDTGIGISEEDFTRVLTPFGQVESALTRKFDGTGLGLPLAKSLAELHAGTLNLESKVGSGTTVTVQLPVHRLVA
jgi:signal transduction histidine kinase